MKKVWHGVNLMSGYESKNSKSLANKVQKATVEYVNDRKIFTTGLTDMSLANASIM